MPTSGPADVASALGKALSSGDMSAMLDLYEGDAVFVPPGESTSNAVRGKGALREVFSSFLGMEPTLTVDTRKVIESGDIALLIGDWALTGKGPDGDVQMSGTFADVVRRQTDGIWLYVIDNPDGVS